MPHLPRNKIVDRHEIGIYHCISRVVRRARLCGYDPVTKKNYNYRKQWIEDLLRHCAKSFAIDLLSFAILDNHAHDKVRNRPDLVKVWSNETVARNWLALYPKRRDEHGNPCQPNKEEIQVITRDKKRVAELRRRLSDISWYHRYWKEKVAKRANAEDEVRGHFFEGRFRSIRITSADASLAAFAALSIVNL